MNFSQFILDLKIILDISNFGIKNIIFILHGDVVAEMAGAIMCHHVTKYVHATWHMRVHVYVHVCTRSCVRECN